MGLAARCGSEIDWASTWDAAASRARKEKKVAQMTAESVREDNWRASSLNGVPCMDEQLQIELDEEVKNKMRESLERGSR